MKDCKCEDYAPTVLRIFLGLLFLAPGLMKLMNPDSIIGMLGGMGFPLAALFGWIVIISEVLGGLALILGYKVKWAVWPLVIVLLVATITVAIPGLSAPMGAIGLLWHILGIAGLISVFLSGAGALSLEKKLA